MIFVDMHAGLFAALEGNAGTGGFGKAVNVVGLDAQSGFDAPAHLFGPRFRTEDTCLQGDILRLIALLFQGFTNVGGIRGRTADNRSLQIHHKLDLTLRITRGHGQGQAANLVRTTIETRTTGEKAVAVSHLADILLCTACGGDGAGAAIFPQINVILSVESYHATAGGTGSGLNTDTIIQRLCQQSVRIGIPQVSLREERQLMQIVDTLDIFGLYALFIHQVTVVGNVFINVLYLLHQLLRLELLHVLPGHSFNFFLIVILCHFDHPFQFCWGSEVGR